VELQVGRRIPLRARAPDRREAVNEVAAGGFGVGERLVAQDPQAEVAHHRVPGHARWRVERPLRGLRIPGVKVRVALRGRLGRAQRLLVGRQVQPLAGGEIGDSAVEERAAEASEAQLAVRGLEPAEVAGHRDEETAGERGQPYDEAPPRPHGDQHVHHGRDDHDQLFVPERYGQPEKQPAGGRMPRSPSTVPDQDGQGGHDLQDGPGVGEDVLLEDELQRVEEHSDGGQRREPRPGAEPDEHRVDQCGRGQPHQVLRQRDDPHGVQQRHRDDQDGVAALPQRVHAPVPVGEVLRVLQVPDAVREDQRRVVGREHHGPQRGREHEQRPEHPVPSCSRGEAQVAGAPVQPDHRSTVTASTGPVGGACRYCQ
jgi:hypothetical protein